MKTGVATVLSLSGVLLAGTAAALVNASVLRPSEPASTPNNAARSLATINTTSSGTADPAPPPATQAHYRVGEAGDVLVDTSGDVLSLVTVTPFDEWVVVSASTTGATVEVVFQHENELRRFTASLVSGVVSTSTSTELLAPPTTVGSAGSPTTTSPQSSHHDDDHGDEDDDGHEGDDDD